MKRILWALLISFLWVTAFLSVYTILIVMNYEGRAIKFFNLPLRLPEAVFDYFFPLTLDDLRTDSMRPMILGISFIAFNIILYSIPIYFVMFIISKFRKPKVLPSNEPPSPPSF